jgi:hypothetical protein
MMLLLVKTDLEQIQVVNSHEYANLVPAQIVPKLAIREFILLQNLQFTEYLKKKNKTRISAVPDF